MFEYKPNKEEMEKRRKELLKELEQENPKPRNRQERRAYARKNRRKTK